jgi:hypothetical protein
MTPAQGTAWAGRQKAIAAAEEEGTVLKKTLSAASAAHADQRIRAPGSVWGRAQALRRLLINWLLIREDADLKLIFHGEVSLGFAFFSKFIMPLAIGHHPLVTWVMFIIAGCLIASGIAVGFACGTYGD